MTWYQQYLELKPKGALQSWALLILTYALLACFPTSTIQPSQKYRKRFLHSPSTFCSEFEFLSTNFLLRARDTTSNNHFAPKTLSRLLRKCPPVPSDGLNLRVRIRERFPSRDMCNSGAIPGRARMRRKEGRAAKKP